jgi:general secretion pathway protein N
MTPARRISIGLLVLAGTFGGLDLAQRLGVGAGHDLPEAARGSAAAPLALKRETFKLPSWGAYSVVLDRPIFNEDRKPTPVAEAAEGEGKEGEATAAPLNATLTSIIITPQVKLAIVKDNTTGTSEVVKVGRPLPGEQNGWTLVEVTPRGATFEGQGLGRQALELAVNESSAGVQKLDGSSKDPAAVPAMAGKAEPQPAGTPAESDAASQTRAEEIRRRIEERRRQLREEAERMRSEQSN